MTSAPSERNLEAQVDPAQEYRVLIRSLKYTQGFGLLFVQCSPAEGDRIIARVRQDLPQKRIEVLGLKEAVDTLYDKIEALSQRTPIDVLFVQGIEHSLYAYEQTRLWSDASETRSYSETAVPRLLQHLNLSRERMRDNFPFHLVFLVPHFALKYLTRRAPDFFDWNSGVLEFALDNRALEQQSFQAVYGAWKNDDPWDLSLEDCRSNLLQVQALIEEPNVTAAQKADLFFERGRLFGILEEYEEAIASYDKALDLNPAKDSAWYNRGIDLGNLGRYEEAIASYDKVIEINPDDDSAWYNRGVALGELGRYEEAIASYGKALDLNPAKDSAWENRGVALGNLGRYEEAIASYDKVLELSPDDNRAWHYRGIALGESGRHEEAIASYDKVIEINPEETLAKLSRAELLFCLDISDKSFTILEEEIKRLTKAQLGNDWRFNLGIHAVFQHFQDPEHWKQWLIKIIQTFETHHFLNAITQGLIRQSKMLVTAQVSQTAAESWRNVWQDLVGDREEFQLPLRLLNAVVEYKRTPDAPNLFLSLPVKERNMLEQLLDIQNH